MIPSGRGQSVEMSLLEVFVWFPASEMMLVSQQSRASGGCEVQSEVGILLR
jgi:hypothetical protein